MTTETRLPHFGQMMSNLTGVQARLWVCPCPCHAHLQQEVAAMADNKELLRRVAGVIEIVAFLTTVVLGIRWAWTQNG